MPNARVDPFPRFNFVVEIEGIARAGFMTVSGLEDETETREYREGGDQSSVRKLAGLNSYSPLVLEMGSTFDTSLWDWRQKVKREGAQGNRKSISIIQQNEMREEVKRWQVFDAWPSKFTGPELDASSSDTAVESVEIQHEGLDLVVKG
ncbi:MAG: phage tail protein [Planctomycetota bacterium]|jgi:phage tail-like protein